MSTSCYSTTPNAFTIEVTSTTTTTYWHDNIQQHGYYSTYRVTALRSGTFEVRGTASGIRRNGMVWEVGIGTSVIYTVTVKEKPVVTSITIPSSLNLLIGSSYTFSPVIAEEGATTQLTWASSSPNVVSVTSGGVINALSVGNSTITCTASNGISATCNVTVSPILVSSITLDKTELELNVDDRYKLTATILPENATNKAIEWTSSNENVAFVSTEGTVIGVSPGYCNIQAIATDGSNVKAGCLVYVMSNLEAYVVETGNPRIGYKLTFYYDREKTSRSGSIYTINDNYSETSLAPWAKNYIDSVFFDSSFINYYPTSTAYWFNGCRDLLTIENIQYLKTDSVKSMESMFADCMSLSSLDVSNFNTENVANFSKTFYYCMFLTFLDVSRFNTKNTTDMSWMFRDCQSLSSLDLSSFNTDRVTTMSSMFEGCTLLSYLDLSSFNTENVETMHSMFNNCGRMSSFDLSGFSTSKVQRTDYMFKGCSNLSSIDISNFDLSSCYEFSCMFEGCTNLKSIDLSHFTSNRKNLHARRMFADCINLTKINLCNDMYYFYSVDEMFNNCTSLKTIYVSKEWEMMSSPSIYDDTFENCISLEGNMGTTFNPLWTSSEYARIDRGESAPGYLTLLGDVNQDCIVSISDITGLIDLLLTNSAASAAADVNYDSNINISDVVSLIDKLFSHN